MKYKFNLKIQSIYGLIGFVSSLIILYLFTKQIDWITSLIIGIANFITAGFYTTSKCK
jgi:hypothetical protein